MSYDIKLPASAVGLQLIFVPFRIQSPSRVRRLICQDKKLLKVFGSTSQNSPMDDPEHRNVASRVEWRQTEIQQRLFFGESCRAQELGIYTVKSI